MPKNILPYFKYLLQLRKITGTYIQRAEKYSHDKITRMLREEIPFRRAYFLLIHKLFGSLSGGYLLLDDVVTAKPFGKKFAEASWIYSSSDDVVVFGYNLVFVCFSNGKITIPLAWRWYRKGSGKTKLDLAIELLNEVRSFWKLKPKYVLFDSWYAASELLDFLHKFNWKFVTQIRRNRNIDGSCANKFFGKEILKIGYITKTRLFKAKVLKHEGKLFATNDLNLCNSEILAIYKERWAIEEVFRYLKTELSLEKCQARTKTSQEKHLLLCVLAYVAVLKEKQVIDTTKSLYAIKESWVLNKREGENRIRHYSKILVSIA